MPPQVATSQEPVESVSCDALVVGAFEDGGPTIAPGGDAVDGALDGALTEYLSDIDFKARVGSVAVVPTLGRLPARAVAVAGLGKRDVAGAAEVRRAAAAAGRTLAERTDIACALHLATPDASSAGAAIEGLLLGAYRFRAYKSEPRPDRLQRILSLGTSQDDVERATALAHAVSFARDLANEPASMLSPADLARRASESADVAGLQCEILDDDALEERGFGGIRAVAQGSARPPRLIILRHTPEQARARVALIGKGITFDSGGLSIKDAKSMEIMKTDMSGGAAVIAAMTALPRLRVPVEVIAYVPATDNMPGGNALRPGDVITHYGGRTTEVLNTDAEGRLVLADALAAASEDGPDAIVDVATLTGAIHVALGSKAAGLFSNDDALARELEDAARAAGERLWRMPLIDDYRSDLDSDVADMKNIGARWGGAIFAALFLREFVGPDIPWAHLDIAGAARADAPYDEYARGATGYGTRTLVGWIEGRAG